MSLDWCHELAPGLTVANTGRQKRQTILSRKSNLLGGPFCTCVKDLAWPRTASFAGEVHESWCSDFLNLNWPWLCVSLENLLSSFAKDELFACFPERGGIACRWPKSKSDPLWCLWRRLWVSQVSQLGSSRSSPRVLKGKSLILEARCASVDRTDHPHREVSLGCHPHAPCQAWHMATTVFRDASIWRRSWLCWRLWCNCIFQMMWLGFFQFVFQLSCPSDN